METVIDVETTVVMLHGKKDSSPYRPHTRLVSVGLEYEGRADYFCIYHTHQPSSEGAVEAIQKVLDDTTLLIGHNIKFDFNWMRSCGFKYDRKIYDTMNWEYLHAGGVQR
jgi:DNA polymerase I-like protein with 3'-5' exonuclease and polymerase domains